MPRLLGVEIPADKRIEASLTYIYGIGPTTSKRVLEQTNIDPNLRAKDLSPQQINEIIHAITNNKIQIEGDLRRETQSNLTAAVPELIIGSMARVIPAFRRGPLPRRP